MDAARTGSEVDDTYRLTATQHTMLRAEEFTRGMGVNLTQIVVTLREDVAHDALSAAWAQVISRHDLLRSCAVAGDPIWQRVAACPRLPIETVDWSGGSSTEQEAALAAYLLRDRSRGIDIFEPPTFRVMVARCSNVLSYMIWTVHHAFMDGASVAVVLPELFAVYDALVGGNAVTLDPAVQFSSYVRWAERQDDAPTRAHWARMLSGATPTALPFSRRASSLRHALYREQQRSVPTALANEIRARAAEIGTTPNGILQSAWAIVLAKHSGSDDVVFASVRSGRQVPFPGVDRVVGPLLFNVPVRVRLDWRADPARWLASLRAEQSIVKERSVAPLVSWEGQADGAEGRVVATSLTVFDTRSLDAQMRARLDQHGRRSIRVLRQPGYGISVAGAYDDAQQLAIRVTYYEDVLRPAEATCLLSQIIAAMQGLVSGSSATLRDITIADEQEATRMKKWSCRAQTYDTGAKSDALPDLITRWANSTPQSTAVCATDGQITYAELNARANRLANVLRDRGARPGCIIGAALRRDTEAVVTLLGIMKTGAAYLPLDPQYPLARTRYMIEDSGAAMVLVASSEMLRDIGCEAVRIELPQMREAVAAAATEPPPGGPASYDAAYIIYTSGSTGRPKGVLVSHANVIRLFSATQPVVEPSHDDVWLAIHSLSFDFSVWEVWGGLVTGGRVVLASQDAVASPSAIWELIRESGTTIVSQTPSFFHYLMEHVLLAHEGADDPVGEFSPSWRIVVFGGEALRVSRMRAWLDRVGVTRPRLVNMYGITETTVHATHSAVTAEMADDAGRNIIGRPLEDLDVVVMDNVDRPAAIGVPGELCVGGAGVSLGYWGRSALTASRFVPHPFPKSPGERLYRSGDLARYNVDGELEYLGRADRQVKLRGFRIELAEIEAVIAGAPGIADVCVAMRDDAGSDPMLVAYVVLREGCVARSEESPERWSDEVLRPRIAAALPSYCMPSAFVVLDQIPLTRNGKVDLDRLPEVASPAHGGDDGAVPNSPVEEAIVALWEEVLARRALRRSDNIFALGCHSILIARAAARLHAVIGRSVPLNYFFEFPVLSDFAREIAREPVANRALTEIGMALLLPSHDGVGQRAAAVSLKG